MMMTIEPIRILMGSDFHFGDLSVSQEEMAVAFAETIHPLLVETDIFFINGDFFDRLVIFDNHGFDPIYDTILNLLTVCQKHGVALRLLQGTWTHDRNQCKRFKSFYRNGNFTFDFKFFEGIDLEEITIRDRSIRVAYVPDDLPFKSSDDVVKVIETKMGEMGWDTIDYACMHGFFDFTFPKNVNQNNVVVYNEAQFGFVTKMIDVGHVHQNRTCGKVISNGSFDRHCFGDEDPKGCIKVLDYPDHYTAHFIENKNAAVYDTIVFTKDDTTETIRAAINAKLDSLTTNRKVHLRCLIESSDHRAAIESWMKDIHPEVKCKVKMPSDAKDRPMFVANSVLITPKKKRVAPTPKTIASFIQAELPEGFDLSTDRIDAYLEPINDKL